MIVVHESARDPSVDIYGLHLFRLVAETGSFTRAGRLAGLTQSAITRQIQNVEARLGVVLLERTTRRVRPTAAGHFLLEQSARILGDVAHSVQRLREEFADAPRLVRVGVSRSIGLAYLPGFFTGFQRQHPQTTLQVIHGTSAEVLAALEARELDVALLCPPTRLAGAFEITHRFPDDFTLIVPAHLPLPLAASGPVVPETLGAMLRGQRWLLPDRRSNTGRRLQTWLEEVRLPVRAAMELDSFDLIINLVALGLGVSFVPHRALPLYARRRKVRRIATAPRFSRELVVVTARELSPREHIRQFVECVLF